MTHALGASLATFGFSANDQVSGLSRLGYDSLDALVYAAVQWECAPQSTWFCRQPPWRRRPPRELPGLRRPQQSRRVDDRAGLPRRRHAGRNPPLIARQPGLVHRVRALPTQDQRRPSEGAAQLSDHGARPLRRPRHRGRVAARPRHGSRRREDRHAPCDRGPDRLCRRRRERAAPDPRGATHPPRFLPRRDCSWPQSSRAGGGRALRDYAVARRRSTPPARRPTSTRRLSSASTATMMTAICCSCLPPGLLAT